MQKNQLKTNVCSIKILMKSFAQIEKSTPKIKMESQGTLNSQNHLEKEVQGWKIYMYFLISKLTTKLQ